MTWKNIRKISFRIFKRTTWSEKLGRVGRVTLLHKQFRSLKSVNRFDNQICGVIYEISLFLIGRLGGCDRVNMQNMYMVFVIRTMFTIRTNLDKEAVKES